MRQHSSGGRASSNRASGSPLRQLVTKNAAAGTKMAAAAQTSSQQFLRIDDDQGGEKRLHLDEEVVRSYLLSDEVADKPVVVISVAGAFRTGKSFLLNSMTRYLKASDKSRWLDDKSESFPWKSGCNAHTNGMSMSQPIPVTLQSGEEAVLLLLDTQGIFDLSSTTADSTRIFALSTLLSSVQVFNVMNNLKSDDLDNLQLFAEYGRLAMNNAGRKPFQDLLFLIRDWHHTHDHALGGQGGSDLIKERLKSNRESLEQRRQHIEACFSSVGGFLLPPPGKAVTGSPTFAGDAEDMEPEFITALEDLMSTLLSPENLSVKMNGSRPMTCGQLANLIETYTNLFQSEELPGAKSILQAGAEAANMAAINGELLTYVKRMNNLVGEDAPMLDEELLYNEHAEAKTDALQSLELQRAIRDPTKPENHYSRLLADKTEDWFKTSQNLFKAKCSQDMSQAREANERLVDACLSSFSISMNTVKSDKPIGEKKIRQTYDKAGQVALERFDKEVLTFRSYSAEESRLRLERMMNEELGMILERDEENAKKTLVQNEFLRYKTRMETLLGEGARMLDEGLLFDEHTNAKAEALYEFKSQLNMIYSAKSPSCHSCLLAGKIDDWFKTSQILFEKCKRDKLKASEVNETLVDECIRSFSSSMKSMKSDTSISEKKIREAYQTASNEVFLHFSGNIVTFGSYTAEESRQRLERAMEKTLTEVLEGNEEIANNMLVQDELLTYKRQMTDLLGDGAPMLDEKLLCHEHVKAKTDALKSLEVQMTIRYSTKHQKYYSCTLADKIEDWFKTSQTPFKEKCERDRQKADEANDTLVDECLNTFNEYMDTLNEDQLKGEAEVRNAASKAHDETLQLYEAKVVTFGSYSARDSRTRLEDSLQKICSTRCSDYEKRRRDASIAKGLKIAAGIVGATGALAAGPVGWATFAIASRRWVIMMGVAAGGAVMARGAAAAAGLAVAGSKYDDKKDKNTED